MKYRVITNTADTKRTAEYIEKMRSALDISEVACDSTGKGGAEIVLGDTSRPISAAARLLLAKNMESAPEGTVGYAIYREGDAIGAVWSDFHMEEAAVAAIAADISAITDGYLAIKTFDLMDYLTERGKRILGEKWSLLEEQIGPEYGPAIVKEMKALYELFPDSIVKWLANLYEPNTGGWYWSNSARHTERYLPSLEETYEAVSFVQESGMAEMFDNDWTKALPKWLCDKIADFFYNLQDEDTFFYLPQWPKEYIQENNCQSRITRDRGSAKTVLRRLGREPKYQNPPAPPKEVKPEEKKDDKPKMLWQYESVENFRKYIEGLEADYLAKETPDKRAWQMYYYGNLLQSTTNYVNAKPDLKPVLIEFLEKYQNPETGMWSEIVCFNATNGLHKIGSVANSIGYRMKYIDKMVDTVMKIIASSPEDNPALGGVDIYNAWSCLPYIYYNILHFGEGTEEERRAKKDEIKRRVLASAAETIKTGCAQMLAFKRDDGAYSYGRFGCVARAQGCPIAVHGSEHCPESDINGNGIAALALKNHIFKALELEEYEVPLYTERERVIFMNIINDIVKNGQVPKKKATFTAIVKDPDEPLTGRCLEIARGAVDIIGTAPETSGEDMSRELIVGDSVRGVSIEARRKLDKALEGCDSDTVGFSIFCGAGNCGIICSDERVMVAAFEHFERTFPACDTVKTFSLKNN